MKISTHHFAGTRTLWNVTGGDFDAAPGAEAVWVGGTHRDLAETEPLACWLAALLGRWSTHQIELPFPVSIELARELRRLFAHELDIGPLREKPQQVYRSDLVAVVVRDELDLLLADIFFDEGAIRVHVGGDAEAMGRVQTAFPLFTNAGLLTRRRDPLDATGDLMAMVGLAPVYRVGHVVGLLAKEEFGQLPPEGLSVCAQMAGVSLSAPLRRLGLAEIAALLKLIGVPDVLRFRALWRRLQMHPQALADGLAAAGLQDFLARCASLPPVEQAVLTTSGIATGDRAAVSPADLRERVKLGLEELAVPFLIKKAALEVADYHLAGQA